MESNRQKDAFSWNLWMNKQPNQKRRKGRHGYQMELTLDEI